MHITKQQNIGLFILKIFVVFGLIIIFIILSIYLKQNVLAKNTESKNVSESTKDYSTFSGYSKKIAMILEYKDKADMTLNPPAPDPYAYYPSWYADLKRIEKEYEEHAKAEKVVTPQTITPPQQQGTVDPNKTQFIAISFDGSKSLYMWETLVNHSRARKATGKDIRFTFFVSGVYFTYDGNRAFYNPPRRSAGRSDIGVSDSRQDIATRVKWINTAFADGHEIASHANGHWDGASWSYDEWVQEFDEFDELFLKSESNAGLPTTLNISKKDIVGFRAPLLAVNKDTYRALVDTGHRYDASGVASMTTWPWKDSFGIWHFPLASLRVGGYRSLSMDYNHFFLQTKAKSTAKRGTPEWGKYYSDVYNSYMNYFNTNYNGARAPLHIGHHFALWNDGVYLQALLDFADQVCDREHVVCGTYTELADMLDSGALAP
ncbi:MAG: hypothetical protein OEX08_00945 [Candidatus Nomurabacteria bacterium]|nr:hypothetical protein [Candidatus Nomurabacteria bacterium]